MDIKCLIIDDEPLAVKVIENYLKEFDHFVLMGSFASAIEALPVLQDNEVDLIFLDINMPKMNGVEFLRSMSLKPQIIITTAYREYAVECFEMDVLDYLVKPIPFGRFLKSIDRYQQRLKQAKGPLANSDLKEAPHIFLKVDKKLVKIKLNDILYIESLKDYIKVITTVGNYLVHKSMSSISEELPSANFIRIHRSFTIAINKINSVEGNTVEIANKRIPIGRNYVQLTKERILLNKL